MEYDEFLTQRFRELFQTRADGGTKADVRRFCFTIANHMCCGIEANAELERWAEICNSFVRPLPPKHSK
jgi:hypothetical protein